MSTIEKRFRRNFIVACIIHVAVIGGIVVVEGVLHSASSNVPTDVQLVVPADILGDLPKGEGQGRGNYAPPPPEPASEQAAPPAAPSPPAATAPEPVAPKAKAAAPEPKDPNEVAIPKKQSVKETKKSTDTSSLKKVATSEKSTTNTVKVASTTKGPAKSTSSGSGTAESASSIRQRFASALAAGEGGTPGGDSRKAGGGTGESKYGHLGSPDGSPDGIAGGVGKGSDFWSYYMHVHDRMYEAWDQPGQSGSLDKKMVTTIVLHVARDGRIEGVKMQHSSGNKLMDDSVIAAAHSVPRLDPLPEGLGGDFADISVNFRLEG